MVRRVTASVDVDAEGAKRGAGETEKSAGRIAGAFDGLKAKAGGFKDQFSAAMGSAQSAAKDKLGPLGDIAEKVGLDLDNLKPSAVLAGGAIAGMTTFVAGGIAKFSALTNEVKAYTSAAGVSAEQGSRLNAVFKGIGVEAEDGADVLKTMGEIIGTDAEKFKTYGVEVVKAKDGTTDMVGTLGAVAQRFAEMTDPAERAALGSELFGDSWVKIAPLLSGGKDKLDKLLASVSKSSVVTDDAIAANDEMAKKLGEARQAIDNLQIAAGKEALPELVEDLRAAVFVLEQLNAANDKVNFIGWAKDLADGMNPLKSGVELWQRWNDEQDRTKGIDLGPTVERVADAMVKAAAEAKPLADAEEAVARASDLAQAAQARAKEESDKLAASYQQQQAWADKLTASTLTVAGSALSYEQAQQSLIRATDDVTEKHGAMTEAVDTYGAESEQAKTATADYDAALLSAKQAAEGQAQAAVDLAEKTATAAGETFTAEQANIVYRDALGKVRDASTDPNLVAGLDALIGLVDANAASAWNAQAAADAAAAAYSRMAAEASGALQQTNQGTLSGSADSMAARIDGARAAGGPAMHGNTYLVGEHGPELFTPGATGFITPPDRLDTQRGPGAPVVVQLVVDGRQLTETTIPYTELIRRSTQ